MPYEWRLKKVWVERKPKQKSMEEQVTDMVRSQWRSLYVQRWRYSGTSVCGGYRLLKPYNPHRLMADIYHIYKRYQVVGGKLIKEPNPKPWVSPWAEGWKRRRSAGR